MTADIPTPDDVLNAWTENDPTSHSSIPCGADCWRSHPVCAMRRIHGELSSTLETRDAEYAALRTNAQRTARDLYAIKVHASTMGRIPEPLADVKPESQPGWAGTFGWSMYLDDLLVATQHDMVSYLGDAPDHGIPGEICKRCSRPVAETCPTWWLADDELWNHVEGGPGGIRCIPCFTRDAEERGITVHWHAESDNPKYDIVNPASPSMLMDCKECGHKLFDHYRRGMVSPIWCDLCGCETANPLAN